MNCLNYKGYYGSVMFSADEHCLYGRILGISDQYSYEGQTVDELELDFRNAVDDYIDDCTEVGKTPELPRVIAIPFPSEFYHPQTLDAPHTLLALAPANC